MRRFDLTRSALADLKTIARYTQDRWGVQQRNVYLREMDRTFRLLAKSPLAGKACDEIRAGYRKFPHGAHVIFYTLPSENELLIVRILHAAMDPEQNIGG